jgi:hypothetical protein
MFDKPITRWLCIAVGALPISVLLGACFTIGQDGPGAAMGYGYGFLIGVFLIGLPSSFRLVRLLRINVSVKKNQRLLGRGIIALYLVVAAPFLVILLVEGYLLTGLTGSLAIYWGLFGFNRPSWF